MTNYAANLLRYVQSNMPKDFDCEKWLDENIDPMWRMLTEQPEAKQVVIIDSEDE